MLFDLALCSNAHCRFYTIQLVFVWYCICTVGELGIVWILGPQVVSCDDVHLIMIFITNNGWPGKKITDLFSEPFSIWPKFGARVHLDNVILCVFVCQYVHFTSHMLILFIIIANCLSFYGFHYYRVRMLNIGKFV